MVSIMLFDAHQNFAYSILANSPGTSGPTATFTVTTGQGGRFPAVGSSGGYNAIVVPAGQLPTPLNAEVIRVTAISGDNLTVTRAQEGTTAKNVTIGFQIYLGVTKKTLSDIESAIASLTSTDTSLHAAVNFVSVSSKGVANGQSSLVNDGAMFGPDTVGTTTCGIQEAVNTFAVGDLIDIPAGGGYIAFSKGIYVCSGQITIPTTGAYNLKWIGCGKTNTVLKYTGTAAAFVTTSTESVVTPGGAALDIIIEDIGFITNQSSQTILLRLHNLNECDINNCLFATAHVLTGGGAALNYVPYLTEAVGTVGVETIGDNQARFNGCSFWNLARGLTCLSAHSRIENCIFDHFVDGNSTYSFTNPGDGYIYPKSYAIYADSSECILHNVHWDGCLIPLFVVNGFIQANECIWESCTYKAVQCSSGQIVINNPNQGQDSNIFTPDFKTMDPTTGALSDATGGNIVANLLNINLEGTQSIYRDKTRVYNIDFFGKLNAIWNNPVETTVSAIGLATKSSIKSILVSNPGSGYTSIPTVTFTGASTNTAVANVRLKAVSAAKVNGGTSGTYHVGDVLNVNGGTPSQTGASIQLTVASVTGSQVNTVNITRAGSFTAIPSNPVTAPGGGGSGATFNITWGVESIQLTDPGDGYSAAPTITISGSHGAAASATLTTPVVIPNNGAMFGPDTLGTTTCGVQEAINSLIVSDSFDSARSGGGKLKLSQGIYRCSGQILIPNTYPFNLTVEGAGKFSTLLMYTGSTVQNFITTVDPYVAPPSSAGYPSLNLTIRDCAMTYVHDTNKAAILYCTYINEAEIHNCLFAPHQSVIITGFGANLVYIDGTPLNKVGTVGAIIHQVSQGNIIKFSHSAFYGLACGIDIAADHNRIEDCLFGDIGVYYPGGRNTAKLTGTQWTTTNGVSQNFYAAGTAIAYTGGVFELHMVRDQWFNCNICFGMYGTGFGSATIYEPIFESCNYGVVTAAAGSDQASLDQAAVTLHGAGLTGIQQGYMNATNGSITTTPIYYGSGMYLGPSIWDDQGVLTMFSITSPKAEVLTISSHGLVLRNINKAMADIVTIDNQTGLLMYQTPTAGGMDPAVLIHNGANWKKISTREPKYLTVSSKGIANSLSEIWNDGCDFGPDTPGTTTCGIQEALNALPAVTNYLGDIAGGGTIELSYGEFNCTGQISFPNVYPAEIIMKGKGKFNTIVNYTGSTVQDFIKTSRVSGQNSNGSSEASFTLKLSDIAFSYVNYANKKYIMNLSAFVNVFIDNCLYCAHELLTQPGSGAAGTYSHAAPSAAAGIVGLKVDVSNTQVVSIMNTDFISLASGLAPLTSPIYLDNCQFRYCGHYFNTRGLYLFNVQIVNAGSGYTAGNTLTVVGGTHSVVATLHVDTVDGSGHITGITNSSGTSGIYTVIPSNPVSVTGGSGTGATFNVNWYLTVDGRQNGTTWTAITSAGNELNNGYVLGPAIMGLHTVGCGPMYIKNSLFSDNHVGIVWGPSDMDFGSYDSLVLDNCAFGFGERRFVFNWDGVIDDFSRTVRARNSSGGGVAGDCFCQFANGTTLDTSPTPPVYEEDTSGPGFVYSDPKYGNLLNLSVPSENDTVGLATSILTVGGGITVNKTVNTSAGTSSTANKWAGRFRISSGNTTYTLTNSFVTSSTIVYSTINTSGAGVKSVIAVPGSGSIVFTLDASPSSNVDVSWWIMN
jgi:hypothetical protein